MPGFDYILVGGGAASCLTALALRNAKPGATICLVERGSELGGNHTWSFHKSDVPASAWSLVRPLVQQQWSDYDVIFPGLSRTVTSPYVSTNSAALAGQVRSQLEDSSHRIVTNAEVGEICDSVVYLRNGERLEGRVVFDGRGPTQKTSASGFQKFFGQEVETESPHDITRPILMDATVAQEDGFRFFYVLPLSPTRLLVEDTYFSDSPQLDVGLIKQRIAAYLQHRKLPIVSVVREEQGVLPMPWQKPTAPKSVGQSIGYRGGWFHPATGYSFALSAQIATIIANTPDALPHFLASLQKQQAMAYRLNNLLFRWFAPEKRWHVFQRFYRLPLPLIERFYSLSMSPSDWARLLLGKPPAGFSLKARLHHRA